MARAALPLRTRLDSASAIAPAVGRRYRPMNSELWQQEPDRWLLAHLLAAPSRSTRHRQGEWSRAARTSGGRACVGRTNDRTTRSSAPLHAGRRAERALPLPAGGRKKCARLENLRRADLLSTEMSYKADTRPAHSLQYGPVSVHHDRFSDSRGLQTRAQLAARRAAVRVRGGEANILWQEMTVPKMQQAPYNATCHPS